MKKISEMKNYKIIFIILCLSLPLFSFSQQSPIDSLLALIKKDKEDTNKVTHFNILAWELSSSNPDTSIILSKQALSLAEKVQWKKGIANSYGHLGTYYYFKADYPKALDYYLKALRIDEELKDKIGMSKRLGNIGNVYNDQGDYHKALDYYFKALKIEEELGNKNNIAIWIGSIGSVYHIQDDYPKALDYYFKALKMAEELGNKLNISVWLGNIGGAYSDEADKITANNNFIKNDSLKQKALDYSFKALKMKEKLGNKKGIANTLGNIGSLYTDTKKYSEAENYLLEALKIDKEIGDLNTERQVEELLTNLYEKTNRHQLALEHYKKAMVLKDTLFSQENKKQLVRKEMNYEFDKKESLAKAEQDKKDLKVEEEKRRQKMFLFSVIGGLLLVVVFSVFMFNRWRVTQKQKKIIEVQKQEVDEQKKIVEEKNKDITDSINYAKRLQEAILPPTAYVNERLPDNFILYKPKDIVAGDFYWMEELDNTIFIAAADCTGHGVPGAMVSVVCSNALNRTVKEFHLRDTGKILDKVTDLVLETFEKSDKDVKDGMDISLLSINKITKQINWSGANNPLWYIPNAELLDITANKQPVGKHDNRKPFTTHTIPLTVNHSRRDGNPQSSTLFYLFTDGFADQFGGPKGKKFKYRQLNDLLLANNNKTMAEQKDILEKAFEDWRGSLEQVDDVLLIGIKL
ncbi:MAG: tetratricopeptide repeat protein [Bacteroidota bacterium]